MAKKNNIINIIDKIDTESKKSEPFNTGLVGEHIIVGAYKTMSIDKLEKMRYIINKIIAKKKKVKAIIKAKEKNKSNS